MLLLVFCSLTSWIPLPKQEVTMLVLQVSGVKVPYCLLLLFSISCFVLRLSFFFSSFFLVFLLL